MTHYNRVTKEIVEELINALGPYNVIIDSEKMEIYSHDETSIEHYAHMPEVVVMPQSSEQVASVMRIATKYIIPVTPRGAGSGLSGGAIPIYGGILLSVERMNRIIEIDKENLAVTCESGIITNDLNESLKKEGLFFAGYPMSLETCFLGGNIAENAGGGRAVKYGVTGRYVLALTVVTPSGEIVHLGGKITKDVSGYDLKQLYIGSEGTLGIITEATIKLLGLPNAKSDLLVPFKTAQEAISAVSVIMRDGIIPTSIEFMDGPSIQMSMDYLNEHLPIKGVGAMLLIEIDGTDEATVERELLRVGQLCEDNGAMEVYIAEDFYTQERIWAVRRNIAEAIKIYSPIQSLEDIVVPIASIAKVLPELDRLSEAHHVKIVCYGHAGDGNLHATIIKHPSDTMEYWDRIEPVVLKELYHFIVYSLGGKISGEHGIGLKRRGFLKETMEESEYNLCITLKKAFDPLMIMNPGKIIDL
ncbi:MAG: FAD-binding oxidoreductase [Spirochaetia bacterium]|nr:FAD-binding oxidoreductase [Spirochaetia bacterium]